MTNEEATAKTIEVYASLAPIHIKTDADFTPPGKRSARIVTHTRGVRKLWFYVSGRRYRDLAQTPENLRVGSRNARGLEG